MTSVSDQQLQSFLPVYDAIPEKWDDARVFLVERLKQIANAVNDREIGYFLDEELLSGKSFIPGVTVPGNNPGIFRQIFRKVIVFPAGVIAGVNTIAHGITFDGNFQLIAYWAAATKTTVTRKATIFGNSDTIDMSDTNIHVFSDGAYNKCIVVIEYLLEL